MGEIRVAVRSHGSEQSCCSFPWERAKLLFAPTCVSTQTDLCEHTDVNCVLTQICVSTDLCEHITDLCEHRSVTCSHKSESDLYSRGSGSIFAPTAS